MTWILHGITFVDQMAYGSDQSEESGMLDNDDVSVSPQNRSLLAAVLVEATVQLE